MRRTEFIYICTCRNMHVLFLKKKKKPARMCSCKVETDRTKMTRNSELNLFQVCTNIIECRSHVVCDAEIERHTVGSRDHARYHPSQGGASRAAHLLPVRRQLHLPRPHICMVYHLRIHASTCVHPRTTPYYQTSSTNTSIGC